MSKTCIEQVGEFHARFDVPILDSPQIPPDDRKRLRMELIREEFEELMLALEADDLVEIADGIGDLHYVLSGTSLEYGIPEQEVADEIHRANMSKVFPHCAGCGAELTVERVEPNHPNVGFFRFRHPSEATSSCFDSGVEWRVHRRADGKIEKPMPGDPPKIKEILDRHILAGEIRDGVLDDRKQGR